MRARTRSAKKWSTWISSDCWQKCECRTSNKRARPFFFFLYFGSLSLLREPSVLEKKKRSISRACTLADPNPKM
jgi:hypothetical protein